MTSSSIPFLTITAFSIGFFHTLLGPDHYLPFIAMSKSAKWPLRKTLLITILCGLGHVLSSVILGIIGIFMGIAVSKLEIFEAFRGDIAAWALIGFGFIYSLWAVWQLQKKKSHTHLHIHADGKTHHHAHPHYHDHKHLHDASKMRKLTPWALFLIFILGPCEPLIPMLMYPAAQSSWPGIIWIAFAYSITTLLTMTVLVFLGVKSINKFSTHKLEKYTHIIVGMIVLLCGIGIAFLGL